METCVACDIEHSEAAIKDAITSNKIGNSEIENINYYY